MPEQVQKVDKMACAAATAEKGNVRPALAILKQNTNLVIASAASTIH